MPLHQVGVEILDRKECLELLRTTTIGRIGFTSGAVPVILPVTFALLEDDVVFRTGSGTKIEAALRRQVACFEADSFAGEPPSGWSVIVTGRTEVVSHPRVLDEVATLGIRSWCGEGLGEQLVRLRTSLVNGRWLQERQGSAPAVDGDGPPQLRATTRAPADLEVAAELSGPLLEVR
jgi:uncharacterized protein